MIKKADEAYLSLSSLLVTTSLVVILNMPKSVKGTKKALIVTIRTYSPNVFNPRYLAIKVKENIPARMFTHSADITKNEFLMIRFKYPSLLLLLVLIGKIRI